MSHINYLFTGRKDVVEILLEAGMDPNCFDGATGRCLYLRLQEECTILAYEHSVMTHSQTKNLGMRVEVVVRGGSDEG